MKYWEIIADKLIAAGWTWGYCSAVTRFQFAVVPQSAGFPRNPAGY